MYIYRDCGNSQIDSFCGPRFVCGLWAVLHNAVVCCTPSYLYNMIKTVDSHFVTLSFRHPTFCVTNRPAAVEVAGLGGSVELLREKHCEEARSIGCHCCQQVIHSGCRLYPQAAAYYIGSNQPVRYGAWD